MTDFIAMIYEWFGYGTDLGSHLRGMDIMCENFDGTNFYFQIFIIMVVVNLVLFILMYLVVDKVTTKFSTKTSWWIMAIVGMLINFGIAFSLPSTVLACEDLHFGASDLMLFGIGNAFWSLIAFAFMTSFPFPRMLSVNARLTTFWKP